MKVEERDEERQKQSAGGRPQKYYQLNENYVPRDTLCINCLNWDRVSPHRSRTNLNTDFVALRKEDECYARWCEFQDKPMFHDEWCPYHTPMDVLHTLTHKHNSNEVLVGFNGRVSIEFNDGIYTSRIYESS